VERLHQSRSAVITAVDGGTASFPCERNGDVLAVHHDVDERLLRGHPDEVSAGADHAADL
jgi:hypothetical protein